MSLTQWGLFAELFLGRLGIAHARFFSPVVGIAQSINSCLLIIVLLGHLGVLSTLDIIDATLELINRRLNIR
jgi:hypothetical protein